MEANDTPVLVEAEVYDREATNDVVENEANDTLVEVEAENETMKHEKKKEVVDDKKVVHTEVNKFAISTVNENVRVRNNVEIDDRSELLKENTKKNLCHLVSKKETPVRKKLRKRQFVREKVDMFDTTKVDDTEDVEADIMEQKDVDNKKVKRIKVSIPSPKIKKIKSPKLNIIKKEKKKSVDKEDKEGKKDVKTVEKTDQVGKMSCLKKPKMIGKIVEDLEVNPEIVVDMKADDDGGKGSHVGRLRDAFEVLLKNGDTPTKTPCKKFKIKRCKKPASSQKNTLDNWLSK